MDNGTKQALKGVLRGILIQFYHWLYVNGNKQQVILLLQ